MMMAPPLGSFADGFVKTYFLAQQQQRQDERSKLEMDLVQKEMKLKEKRAQFEELKYVEELKQRDQKHRAQLLMLQLFNQPQRDPLQATLGGMTFETLPGPDHGSWKDTGGAPYTAGANPVLQQALAPRPQPAGLAAMPDEMRQLVPALLLSGNEPLARTVMEPYLPKPPKAAEPFTLRDGETRFDARGQRVAHVPKAPPTPKTPYEGLVAAGMDPYAAFVKLEEGRNQLRAKYRAPRDTFSVTTPDGTTVAYGAPTLQGTKPLGAVQQLSLAEEAEALRLGLDTLRDLQGLVVQDPTAFGKGADLRQTVVLAGKETGRFFQGLLQSNQQLVRGLQPSGAAVEQLVQGLTTGNVSRGDYLFNTLIIQQAVMNNPGGRITDKDVDVARQQVGGPIKSGDDFLARSQEMQVQLRRRYQSLQRKGAAFKLGIPDLPAAPDTAAPGSTPTPRDPAGIR
jgi:hypothetical protein